MGGVSPRRGRRENVEGKFKNKVQGRVREAETEFFEHVRSRPFLTLLLLEDVQVMNGMP
jgi:hypothetical protein